MNILQVVILTLCGLTIIFTVVFLTHLYSEMQHYRAIERQRKEFTDVLVKTKGLTRTEAMLCTEAVKRQDYAAATDLLRRKITYTAEL
jgi:hypothetical protein